MPFNSAATGSIWLRSMAPPAEVWKRPHHTAAQYICKEQPESGYIGYPAPRGAIQQHQKAILTKLLLINCSQALYPRGFLQILILFCHLSCVRRQQLKAAAFVYHRRTLRHFKQTCYKYLTHSLYGLSSAIHALATAGHDACKGCTYKIGEN